MLFDMLFKIGIVEIIILGVIMFIGHGAGTWISSNKKREKIYIGILVSWLVLIVITIILFIYQNEKMLGELLA